ncbi:hypothetical protein AB0L06_35505 [Spirillospora sp. NPDC052269]
MATVKFAAYGALKDGNPDKTQAMDVTAALQTAIDGAEFVGLVTIDNDTLGGDPAKNSKKHFAAIVNVDGQDRAFACQEGQTINFG